MSDNARRHPAFMARDERLDILGGIRGNGSGRALTRADLDGAISELVAKMIAERADPWTYIRLAADFSTTSATAVDIPGLSFGAKAGKTYLVDARLLLRTATATVGPRPGIYWPAGLTDGVAEIRVPSSATGNLLQYGNIAAAFMAPVGGLPNTTQSWLGTMLATFTAGATPSGLFRLQLASETAGTSVTVKAGSWIRYRTI